MFDSIFIRFAELSTKKKNRFLFIEKLASNLKKRLVEFTYLKINSASDHILICLNEHQKNQQDIENISKIISNTFGIASYSFALQVIKDLNLINANIFRLLESLKFKSFQIKVNRVDKKFGISSHAIAKCIGTYLQSKNAFWEVDLTNPDKTVYLEIKHHSAFIFLDKKVGLHGLPVGSTGKVLLLLSGGIDSPVAAYQLMKRGLEVHYLHFATPPYSSKESLDKVFKLQNLLESYHGGSNDSELYWCNFSKMQNEILHLSEESYRIIIMRRMFVRIANTIAKKYKIKAIALGDCISQVASQTVESMSVIDKISDLLILRPLLTYDKYEIINIAKKIGTYETSILPFFDCCNLFVPPKPVIKPIIKIVEQQEEEIFWPEILELIIANKIFIREKNNQTEK